MNKIKRAFKKYMDWRVDTQKIVDSTDMLGFIASFVWIFLIVSVGVYFLSFKHPELESYTLIPMVGTAIFMYIYHKELKTKLRERNKENIRYDPESGT